MADQKNSGWRAVIGSSSIMSLALLGDALIYAVLPVYAEEFGLTLPWVGVMLSANRFVRVFAYGLIARVTQSLGVRMMCIIAAIMATLSTAMYGVSDGPILMLIARIIWGLTYAILVLATLVYAVENRSKVGIRVGVGRAIQRSGPVFALLGGAWLVGVIGPQSVFLFLALPTAASIFIALTLPKTQKRKAQSRQTVSLARPQPIDIMFFLQGYGVDGVFAISITLILARETTLATAVMGGGFLLALRHFTEAAAAPLFGWVADTLGARKVFVSAAIFTMIGFICIASGFYITGALIMLFFRGALASLGPAVIAQSLSDDEDAIAPLAKMQAWRDLGAACGPLFTGFLFAYMSPELQHGIVAIALALSLIYWQLGRFPTNLNQPDRKCPERP
ncbi:MAG: MFS transporter [Pikeienuella sp.]